MLLGAGLILLSIARWYSSTQGGKETLHAPSGSQHNKESLLPPASLGLHRTGTGGIVYQQVVETHLTHCFTD